MRAGSRRGVVIGVVAVVLAVCAGVVAVVSAIPEHRTVLLVDSAAPGADLPAVADAVAAIAGNVGSDDAMALRRYGGECGSADNTAELTDDADDIGAAVRSLRPAGSATLLSGLLAAADDFSGMLPFRGSARNRVVVVTATGVDACATDQAQVWRAARTRLAESGLDIDLRIVGYRMPQEQRDQLAEAAGEESVSFAEDPVELTAVLDRLVVPNTPEAADISVAGPPETVYAFAATSRLGVVRGGEVIAEVPTEPNAFGDLVPAFTTDGRFAFAAGGGGVAVVEVETGSARTVACGGCDLAVPVGESRIAWLADGRIMVLDAEATDPEPGPTVRFEPTFPPFSEPLRLVAGAPDRVVVAGADGVSAYGGPEELIVVDLAGGQRSVGTIDGNTRIGTVVVSPDGSRLAYDAAWHAGACEEQGHVAVVDLASGEQRTTEDIGPRTSRPEGGAVFDLWFDRDGVLHTVFSKWTCEASGGPLEQQLLAPTHWRLAQDGWTRADVEPVSAVREVGPGVRAVITGRDTSSRVGTLHTEVDGIRTPTAEQVLAIAMPD